MEIRRWIRAVDKGDLPQMSLIERRRVVSEPTSSTSPVVPYLPDGPFRLIGGASEDTLDPEERLFCAPLVERFTKYRHRRPTPVSYDAALAASMCKYNTLHSSLPVPGSDVLAPYM